jgi:hypothetical protein
MLHPNRNRTATRPHPTARVTSPNAGRWPAPTYTPDTDDVLIADTGWLRPAHTADHVAHRPGPDGQPACPAYTSNCRWHRIAAGHARTQQASPCREQACYPAGWDW